MLSTIRKMVQVGVEKYHLKSHGLCASLQKVKGLSLHLFHYLPYGMVSLTVLCLVAQSLLVLSLPLGLSSSPEFSVCDIRVPSTSQTVVVILTLTSNIYL